MARYSDRINDDRDLYAREERSERGPGWEYDDSYRRRISRRKAGSITGSEIWRTAAYEYDEPRYGERRNSSRRRVTARSRLTENPGDARPGSTMVSSLASVADIATETWRWPLATLLSEVAIMMKQEDTGVVRWWTMK